MDGSVGPEHTTNSNVESRLAELADAGHPVIRIVVGSKIELGAEFVRWEVATALAGHRPGHRPVRPAQRRGSQDQHSRSPGRLREGQAGAGGTTRPWRRRRSGARRGSQGSSRTCSPNGYASIQAYIAQTPARDKALAEIRTQLRDGTHRATTVGYGPRFLHSTGQLHKGGAPIGWFLQLVSEHPTYKEHPRQGLHFGQLIDAQAIGDARTIESHNLPILRINLGPDADAGLAAVERALAAALKEA
jgi:transaldolase/glucose-6-phosphate isomerase